MLTIFIVGLVLGLVVGFTIGHRFHPFLNTRMRIASGVLGKYSRR